MRVLARCCFALITVFAFDVLHVARAAPFGATAIGPSATYSPCTDSATAASIPVTVDVPSRLLVSISGSAVSIDDSVAYGVGVDAELFDASGTTLLNGVTYYNIVVGVYLNALSNSGVLFDPSTTQPLTLTSGSYLLKLNLQTSGSCGGAGVYLQNPTLTYVLLSSVIDRIFANGFAVLEAGDDTGTQRRTA